MNNIKHIPIMVKEIINHLPAHCQTYVDGTTGHAGHIVAILESGKLATNATIFAIDRDKAMLEKASSYATPIAQQVDANIVYIQGTYADIDTITSHQKVDFILLDIGVNMEHFKDGSRGFSVHDNAPLDMRFDTRGGQTAADVLNTYPADTLEHMFLVYGDFAPSSASFFTKHIIEHRKSNPFATTQHLIDFLYKIGVRKNQLPIIFQCLRIEANQELEQLEQFLKKLPNFLNTGGRCAIITFHSIEDRMVKYAFKELDEQKTHVLVNKKVIIPHYTEVQKNRASRSAKLRIIEKIT